VKPRLILAALALSAALPAVDHPAWSHLDGEVVAAVRWHGGGTAAADSARQRWCRIFATPQIGAAAARTVSAALASSEELAAPAHLVASLGFGWGDLGTLFGSELGCAFSVRPGGMPNGRTAAELAAWAVVPDELWARAMTAIEAQVAAGTILRTDVERDGRRIHLLAAAPAAEGGEPVDAAAAVHRDADGRVWLLVSGAKVEPQGRADRLARWIAAPGGETGFAARAQASRTLGGRGAALLESAADFGQVWRRIQAEVPAEQQGMVAASSALLGLDALGFAAFEVRCDGGWCGTALALQTSGPRRGILRVLDAPATPAQPAAWLPAEALSVSCLVFDAGQVLEGVRQAMSSDPTLRGHLETAENAVPVFAAGLTLQQITAALGRTLWQVDLPETPEQLVAGDDRKGAVLELADPTVVSRLLPLANLAAKGMQVRFVTEQGAQGLRIAAGEGTPEIGVFISGQHLVVGIGSGVASELLAALGRGDGRWAATPHAAAGLRQLPARQLLLWGVEDSQAVARLTPDLMRTALDGFAAMSDDEEVEAALGDLADAMPDAEAVAASIAGPQTTAAWDDAGVIRVLISAEMALEP
jgi:hypothetical protein